MQKAVLLLATVGSLASARSINKHKNEPHLTITLFNEQDCLAKVEPIDINHTHHVGKCWTKDVGFHSFQYTIDPKHSHFHGRTCHVDIWQGPKCQGPAQKGADVLLEAGHCRNTDWGLPAGISGLSHSYMVVCDEPQPEIVMTTMVFPITKRDVEPSATALAERDVPASHRVVTAPTPSKPLQPLQTAEDDDEDTTDLSDVDEAAEKFWDGLKWKWHGTFRGDRRDAPAPAPAPKAEPTVNIGAGEGGIEVMYISADIAPSATNVVAFVSEDGYEHAHFQGVPADSFKKLVNDE